MGNTHLRLHTHAARAIQCSNMTGFNPTNAEAAFIQSTRTQQFLKTIKTLSCCYSWILSDVYQCARVSIIFHFFLYHFVLTKLATSSIRDICFSEIFAGFVLRMKVVSALVGLTLAYLQGSIMILLYYV